MNAMICTSSWGSRSRSRPSQQRLRLGGGGQGEAGEHAEGALDEQRRCRPRSPCWLTLTPSTSVCGPVATNGSSSAKTTNGTSTTIRLRRYVGGTREIATTTAISGEVDREGGVPVPRRGDHDAA